MNTSTRILGMTAAAVALLSAPALAETVKVQVGETVTYEVKDVAQPGDNVVGYQAGEMKKFTRMDANADGSVSRKEFYNKVMLDNEAEIFSLFDTDQSNEISPEEFSNNSRFGNAEITNNITNETKSKQNWGSLRAKYYSPSTLAPSSESTPAAAEVVYQDVDKMKKETTYN